MNDLPKEKMGKTNSFWEIVNRYAVFGAMFFLLLMMLLVVCDALGRSLLAAPIPGAAEGTSLLMPWIIFLPLAYTLAIGEHVRLTLLYDRMPKSFQLTVEIIDCIIGIAFFVILTYYSWNSFWGSFVINEFMMAPIKLPWWPGKLGMPIGTFIMIVQFVLLMIAYIAKLIRRIRGEK